MRIKGRNGENISVLSLVTGQGYRAWSAEPCWACLTDASWLSVKPAQQVQQKSPSHSLPDVPTLKESSDGGDILATKVEK